MRSGDRCPECGGTLRVGNTLKNGNRRRHYLKCKNDRCDFTAKDSFLIDEDGRRIEEVDRMRETIRRQAERINILETMLSEAGIL